MLNNLGIISVQTNQPRLDAGQPAEADYQARSYAQSILEQISTITYTGAVPGNGVYSASITRPDGTVVTASTASLTSPTLANIATAIAAALNAAAGLIGYMTASPNAGVVTITFSESYAGVVFPIATTTQSGTTVAVANTQDAGSVPAAGMPIGRAVVRVNDPAAQDALTFRMRLPQSGDTEAAIVGVVLRDLAQPNTGAGSVTADERVAPGTAGAVAYQGTIAVRNARGTATPGTAVNVQIISNGGVEPGQFAASADGGNSVALGATRAVWLDNVAVGAVGRIRVNMIG